MCFFDLSGLLRQAMAVRRNWGPMVMVMTVMAVALHLFETISRKPALCQSRVGNRSKTRTVHLGAKID
jgi:hypothetical protein